MQTSCPDLLLDSLTRHGDKPHPGDCAAIGAKTLCSPVIQESGIEADEHQDDADVRREPLPEMMAKDQQIQCDDDGHHGQDIKNQIDILWHLTHLFKEQQLPLRKRDSLSAFLCQRSNAWVPTAAFTVRVLTPGLIARGNGEDAQALSTKFGSQTIPSGRLVIILHQAGPWI
jgi:hypothetical protein